MSDAPGFVARALWLALALATLAPALGACSSPPDDPVSRAAREAKRGL